MSTLPEPPRDRAITLETRSAEETRRLAASITPILVPGDVIALAGELGGGKTTFVQGLGAGLGVPERVTSPTFILMKEYTGGRYPLMHIDVFRLKKMQEVIDLGYDEFLDPSYIVAVEWGDAVEPLLPREHLRVEFHLGEEELQREVVITPRGLQWASRTQTLRILTADLFQPAREADPSFIMEQLEKRKPARPEEN